jgi:hypothetical protein
MQQQRFGINPDWGVILSGAAFQAKRRISRGEQWGAETSARLNA